MTAFSRTKEFFSRADFRKSLDRRRFFSDGAAYLRCERHEIGENDVVFDVGGGKGRLTGYIMNHCSPKRIHVFEPVDDLYSELDRKFGGEEKVFLHGYGLGDGEGEKEIEVNDIYSSIHRDTTLNSQKIEVKDAGEIVKKLDEEEIKLIDINVEGSEYEILESLIESGAVKSIENIQVQFHKLVENAEKKRREIHERLEETHELDYEYFFVFENWKRKDRVSVEESD